MACSRPPGSTALDGVHAGALTTSYACSGTPQPGQNALLGTFDGSGRGSAGTAAARRAVAPHACRRT